MHSYGKVAGFSFLGAFVLQVSAALAVFYYHQQVKGSYEGKTCTLQLGYLIISSCVVFSTSCFISKKWLSEQIYQIVWRSFLLGVTSAVGLITSFSCHQQYFSLGWYILVMSFFHFSEFMITSIIRPKNLSQDSFLLNHSKAYGIAALTSWIEYLFELYFFPGLKSMSWISLVGLLLCLGGEIFRKTAMLTAFHNFDHLIRTRREEHHHLVTSGIYSLCRHPSYVGWFYWSIGTQVILCNPLCAVAYTVASWKFFHERVFEEEMTLLHFFGHEYATYQSKVPTGLPFIHGYSL